MRYVRYTLACNARSLSWFEFSRHFESHLASLLYAHANITTSDEHSNVTMLHSTRTTYSFKDGWVGAWGSMGVGMVVFAGCVGGACCMFLPFEAF